MQSDVENISKTIIMEQNNHIWNFSSVGGVKRVNLESGQDLVALPQLDQKLWTALSCPVSGLEIDQKTLELIDNDKDGRIRVPEILEAVKWITAVIKNPDDLLKQSSSLPLASINTDCEEGRLLLASAHQILNNIGKGIDEEITVEETSDIKSIFANTKFNGDGFITEDSCDDDSLKLLVNDIISCYDPIFDRNGKSGVSKDNVTTFYESCKSFSDWYLYAENDQKNIFPFGDQTELALQSYLAIKTKVDDYFIRCRLAEFDPQSADVLNVFLSRYESISAKDLSSCLTEIAEYPIAKISSSKRLSLDKGLNPAWEAMMFNFVKLVVKEKFPNNDSISETEWIEITKLFDAFISWKNDKKGAEVEHLGLERIREILKKNQSNELFDLIEKDLALETEAKNIILVDKLVRYYRDIYKLLKNFVTFYDFYSSDQNAIFQAGTLFIDQRSCDLCIRVTDMARHSTMATLSGMFLIYCECVSKVKNEKMTIVAAMTNGDIDNLIVGRNAIFYDTKGLDWDATVVKIVENPISIRQAFWSPYRKVARFIETQIDKFASARESQVQSNATSNIEQAHTKIETTAKAPAQPFDVGKFVGIFAAIGLAIGAIGTALASFIAGFLGLVWWKMPLAIVGIILIISGPSMIIAWLKLRKRNLAPILDANGWAINAHAVVNIPFGNTLTHIASLPKNARINLIDPFSNKKRPFWKIAFVLLLVLGIVLWLLWKYANLKVWLFGA